jgi:hypothetical protein
MNHDRKTRLAARLLLLVASAAATPAAAASFDGSWNVSIVTRTGSCESGASLPIRIMGLNRYRDSAHFEVGSQLIGQP